MRRRVPWAALALVGSATASLAASGCASTLEHRAREAAESGIDPAPLVAELQAQFEAIEVTKRIFGVTPWRSAQASR